jgi:AcrR family transcriptional regulator
MNPEKKEKPKVELILKTAGEIFAEQGFRKATVRDICKRSGVNLAAINYYFGNKEKLYLAVLKYYRSIALQKYPSNFGINESDSPRKKLSSFIQSFIVRLLEEGKQSLFGKLFAREFFEPTGALDILVEEAIKPTFSLLSSIVREILGNNYDIKKVELCAMSILGQCLYFRNAKPIIFRMRRKDRYSKDDIKEISEHIINLSLKGLLNY